MKFEELLERREASGSDSDKIDAYLDMVLYYFKYRECNPRVLELMIESFKIGGLFFNMESLLVKKDGKLIF